MANKDRFAAAYERNLRKAVIEHPDEYSWPVENVAAVAAKMMAALERGSANKDGRAFRATCKELGIAYTYKAIQRFLQDD
jgi:hypothetical protein